jgi:leucyl aminopeptidase
MATPAPTVDTATVTVASTPPPSAQAIGVLLGRSEEDETLGLDARKLAAASFDGQVGSTLLVPTGDSTVPVAVGIGESSSRGPAGIRDAAAAYARAVAKHQRLALRLPDLPDPSAERDEAAAQAAVEGVLLARYRYDRLRAEPTDEPVRELTLLTGADRVAASERGARRGRSYAAATMRVRDLANTPHSHLTAAQLAEIATRLGQESGFEVEVYDEDAIREMRLGGLLAVNAGSAEPPRMIKLTYRPVGEPTARLALVGKGIMFDSGGLSLKPSDASHAQMKNDMTGAAAVLSTVATLGELDCTTAVTGYLMCTDNMPSATATVLGDVYTARNGTTVEVIDTDAEGRLVMAEALTLAAEDDANDAVVDIATLTGSVGRALGNEVAGVFGNNQSLVDQVRAAAAATDEPVWQLPLRRSYREHLKSTVADIANVGPLGSPDGILAALFLADFVGNLPWAHIDIAGVATNSTSRTWHPEGCSGFGTRLLIDLVTHFDAKRLHTDHNA